MKYTKLINVWREKGNTCTEKNQDKKRRWRPKRKNWMKFAHTNVMHTGMHGIFIFCFIKCTSFSFFFFFLINLHMQIRKRSHTQKQQRTAKKKALRTAWGEYCWTLQPDYFETLEASYNKKKKRKKKGSLAAAAAYTQCSAYGKTLGEFLLFIVLLTKMIKLLNRFK